MLPLLALFCCAAAALAWARVPYDDEWFSIELARASWPEFWGALAGDVHPPWIALLDRGIAQIRPSPLAAQLARVPVTVAAVALLAAAFARPLGLPRHAFVLAAVHPIVLFYAAAARWYPFLMLAHALRAWAVMHPRPASPASGGAFVSGALLGSIAAYIDPLFVLHDGAWLAVRARSRAVPWLRLALIGGAAALAVAALRTLSPLERGFHSLRAVPLTLRPVELAQFAGLGSGGEALPPWPWTLCALLPAAAIAWSAAAAAREAPSRPAVLWIATYAATWAIAVATGVWHPRYSLALWLLAAVLIVRLWISGGRGARALAAMAGAHLAVSLALAASGRGFVKADLNDISAAECRQLSAAAGADVLIVPYVRLAEQLEQTCPLPARVLRIPNRRITDDYFEPLRAALPGLRAPALLTTTGESITLQGAQDAIHALLARRCTRTGLIRFGTTPHDRLRWASGKPVGHRLELERWACGAPEP